MVKHMAPEKGIPSLSSQNSAHVQKNHISGGLRIYQEDMADAAGYLCRSWPCSVDHYIDLDHKVTWFGRSVSSSCVKTAVSRASSCSELVANGNLKYCPWRSRCMDVEKLPVATENHLAMGLLASRRVNSRPVSLSLDAHQGISLLQSFNYSPVSTSSRISCDSAMDINNQSSEDEHSDMNSLPLGITRTDFVTGDTDQSHDLDGTMPSLHIGDYNMHEGVSKKTGSSSNDQWDTLSPPAVVISDHSYEYPWSADLINNQDESSGADALSLSYDFNTSSTIEMPRQRRVSLTSSYGSGSSMKSLLSDDSSLSVDEEGDVSMHFVLTCRGGYNGKLSIVNSCVYMTEDIWL